MSRKNWHLLWSSSDQMIHEKQLRELPRRRITATLPSNPCYQNQCAGFHNMFMQYNNHVFFPIAFMISSHEKTDDFVHFFYTAKFDRQETFRC